MAAVGVTGDRITFLGDAAARRVQARDTVDVQGMVVTPGLIGRGHRAEPGGGGVSRGHLRHPRPGPGPGQAITHPRVFGAFTKKLRDFVLDEEVISLPFAVRSMTGLAADFMGWPDRGYLREGYHADIAVLELDQVQDLATYEEPQQYSEGTVHVILNGEFALRNGELTGVLAGRPLVRGGGVFQEGAGGS